MRVPIHATDDAAPLNKLIEINFKLSPIFTT
jgi:hypothetical protein